MDVKFSINSLLKQNHFILSVFQDSSLLQLHFRNCVIRTYDDPNSTKSSDEIRVELLPSLRDLVVVMRPWLLAPVCILRGGRSALISCFLVDWARRIGGGVRRWGKISLIGRSVKRITEREEKRKEKRESLPSLSPEHTWFHPFTAAALDFSCHLQLSIRRTPHQTWLHYVCGGG